MSENQDFEGMDRGSILMPLKMAVLTNEMQGRTLPQELTDKVDAAAGGDTSIDLLELMNQINDAMPESDEDAIDYADVTFSGGNIAKGTHFTVACPDGWTVVEDYEDSGLISQRRPFVIVRGEASRDDDLSLRDRIIYCIAPEGDEEVTENLRSTGIELLWGLKRNAMYSMRPGVAWLEDVACSNGECVVAQMKPNGAINGLQFLIHPLTLASEDFVRLSLTYDEDADIEHARDFARKVAASIAIAEPFESETTKAMERADKGELSADEFAELCQALFTSFRIAPQLMFEAKAEWYMTNGEAPNVEMAYLVGAEEIAALNNRLTPLLRRLLDEYNLAKPKASHDDRAKMLNVLSQFTEAAFTGPETFGDEDVHMVVESGILEPSKEFSELKARLADELKQEGLSEG